MVKSEPQQGAAKCRRADAAERSSDDEAESTDEEEDDDDVEVELDEDQPARLGKELAKIPKAESALIWRPFA